MWVRQVILCSFRLYTHGGVARRGTSGSGTRDVYIPALHDVHVHGRKEREELPRAASGHLGVTSELAGPVSCRIEHH